MTPPPAGGSNESAMRQGKIDASMLAPTWDCRDPRAQEHDHTSPAHASSSCCWLGHLTSIAKHVRRTHAETAPFPTLADDEQRPPQGVSLCNLRVQGAPSSVCTLSNIRHAQAIPACFHCLSGSGCAGTLATTRPFKQVQGIAGFDAQVQHMRSRSGAENIFQGSVIPLAFARPRANQRIA